MASAETIRNPHYSACFLVTTSTHRRDCHTAVLNLWGFSLPLIRSANTYCNFPVGHKNCKIG